MTTLLTNTLPKIKTLADTAVLVDLTIRQWTAGKQDSTATSSVTDKFQIDGKMGHYYKRLISTDHLAEIRKHATRAYTNHTNRTLPWLDSGQRILSSIGYFDYISTMGDITNDFDTAVSAFVAKYEELVEDSKTKLKDLFNVTDYPRAHEIAGKFGIDIHILPVPSSGDFRVNISGNDRDWLTQQLESLTSETNRRAVNTVLGRIEQVLSHLHGKLLSYDGRRSTAFRDSSWNSVIELAHLLPSLNITDNTSINSIHEKLQIFETLDVKDVRKDMATRNQVIIMVASILEEIKAASSG